MSSSKYLHNEEPINDAHDQAVKNGCWGTVVWFTGLSGSGKSTLAKHLWQALYERDINSYILDGDVLRKGLNKNLGFSSEDRQENVRRVAEVAKLFADAGLIAIVALISPYRSGREMVRQLLPKRRFVEIFLDCPVEVCAKRDPKGLYSKAQTGEIQDFTGISAPYEPPLNPELTIKTHDLGIQECVQVILNYLLLNHLIQSEKNILSS